MKLFFKLLVFLSFFIFNNLNFLYANEFKETYDVEVGSIYVGELLWRVRITGNKYKITINLQDRGILSGLYNFEGNYEASGFIIHNILIPKKYKQIWLAKKNKRSVEIFFDNGELINLELSPKEKESSRVQYLGIRDYIDPLSSFLNILLGKKESKTIDGRRIYSMVINEHSTNIDKEIKRISIENYINLWADHKRNDLKYIEIIQELEGVGVKMPSVVKIKFKSFVFKLTKI